MSGNSVTHTVERFAIRADSSECISGSLDLLPTEEQARRMIVGTTMHGTVFTGFGLYAKVPGKPMIFVSPVWTCSEDGGRKTVNFAAKLDALELLNEFKRHDLSITLRNIQTRQIRMQYGAEVWESGFDLIDRG